MKMTLLAAWATIRKEIGTPELSLALALMLLGAGCWQVWRPAALLVPGLVILWLCLPIRGPFIERKPDVESSGRKR